MSIKPEELAKEISEYLREFSLEAIEVIDKASKKISQDAVKQLKQTTPRDRGDYAKGWRVTKDKKSGAYIIHNKHYRLTHLVEKGHATANGGRVKGVKHIEPVERKAVKRFYNAVVEGISK